MVDVPDTSRIPPGYQPVTTVARTSVACWREQHFEALGEVENDFCYKFPSGMASPGWPTSDMVWAAWSWGAPSAELFIEQLSHDFGFLIAERL